MVVDEFTNTPGVSPSFELDPDKNFGHVIIRDKGDGMPVLVNLRIHQPFEEDVIFIQPFGMIPPGSLSVSRDSMTDHAVNQLGTGSTSTTIDWGFLTGWKKTGFAFCQESPAVLLNVLCAYAGWVSAVTLVPPPSRASAFDTGVWTFTPDMSAFNSPKFLYQTFVGGSNNTQWRLRGELVQIPALPLLGAGAVGAALVYLGVRSLRSVKP